MTLLFAAFGAIVAALLESTVIPYLRIGDAQPHLVFVLTIIVTVVAGFDRGLVFAFVGGLRLVGVAHPRADQLLAEVAAASRRSPILVLSQPRRST